MLIFLVISEYYVEAVFTDLELAGKYLNELTDKGKLCWLETHEVKQ